MTEQDSIVTIEEALALAAKHRSGGDLPKAESIYRQILDTDPNHYISLHMLGVIAHEVGKNDVAVELITKATALEPGYTEAYNNLGIAFHHQGNFEQAITSYHKAIAIVPDFAEVHNNLGVALVATSKLEEAVASYEKAVALKPEYAEGFNNLGNAYRSLGRQQDAIRSCEKALTLNPNLVDAHYNLALLKRDSGQPEQAVSSLQRALVIDPNYGPALLNLGALLHELNNPEEAITHYQAVLIQNPDFAEVHNNLGAALQSLARFDKAIASYRKAISPRPNYAEAFNNLGLALREIAMNSDVRNLPPAIPQPMDEAIANYQKALDLEPGYSDAHYNLANALQDIGQLEESAVNYQKSVSAQPDNSKAWTNFVSLTKALQFSGSYQEKGPKLSVEGLSEPARESVGFSFGNYWLSTFRPHEADESFQTAIAGLPQESNEPLIIQNNSEEQTEPLALPNKVVALLHFGRSGTGLLHSLIDGHPEISTLPSIYLRGFFNEGVWNSLTADGWRNLPRRFADQFEVLFNANSQKSTPGALAENSSSLGKKEGMTCVGENRDESLSLDRDKFCTETLRLMSRFKKIDPALFFLIIHAVFEKTLGTKTEKHTTFYHLHNPLDFTKLNFLRNFPDARLLMMVREPVQSCESWARFAFIDNDYASLIHRIVHMLLSIDQIEFRNQDSIGIRLEDIKERPESTLKSLSYWLGIQETPSLYEMTAQGKKWWGDPTSPDYSTNKPMSPFDTASTRRPAGTIFSEQDQFILRTLYYPFRVRFGYQEPNAAQFTRDLQEIQPLFSNMLGFEEVMLQRTRIDQDQFQHSGPYLVLRACFQERWNVLNQYKDYPHMLQPLRITGLNK